MELKGEACVIIRATKSAAKSNEEDSAEDGNSVKEEKGKVVDDNVGGNGFESMIVVELKAECEKRGLRWAEARHHKSLTSTATNIKWNLLSVWGKKADLIERLNAFENENKNENKNENEVKDKWRQQKF